MRSAIVVLILVVACGGDDAPPEMDATMGCTSDAECDDGLYCTGEETCSEGMCMGGALPCDDLCDEDTRECLMGCAIEDDADGDGARAIACGGDDCDDENPDRFPGNTEICDAMDRDEDCDPTTFGFRDLDGDGVADAACCNGDNCGTDCNDADGGVSSRSPEVCNEVDDDCDGNIDEDLLLEFWPDADNDGFGANDIEGGPSVMSLVACSAPALYAGRRGDCNDEVPEINPGNPEVCDDAMIDENCDGEVNIIGGMACACTPGDPPIACEFTAGICAGSTRACVDGRRGPCSIAPRDEVCDEGADEDCDGEIDEGLTLVCYPDADRDGYAEFGAIGVARCPVDGACPDQFTARNPVDRSQADCDDRESEERVTVVCLQDLDGDGFGAGTERFRCECEGGEVEFGPESQLDCCDERARDAMGMVLATERGDPANAYPGQGNYYFDQVCEGFDYDCNGEEEYRGSVIACYSTGTDCRRLPSSGELVPNPDGSPLMCGTTVGIGGGGDDDCVLDGGRCRKK